jgi:beta-barrel assembly-enhancing protease
MVKALVVSLAIALAASAQTYSAEKEIAIGRQLAAEVERQSKTLAPGEDVRRIAQSIERYAGLDVPLTLKLIDTRVPEVIALPGGFLFLSSGLIVRLEGEAELAGVLAHAIAHLAAHHGIRTDHTSNLASVPIIFMGTWRGVCMRLVSEKILLPVSLKSAYARWEVEADQLALDYLRRAGYDPIPLLPIFEKLRAPLLPESHPKSVPTLHPERPPR